MEQYTSLLEVKKTVVFKTNQRCLIFKFPISAVFVTGIVLRLTFYEKEIRVYF
jgi:hypothetical protein